MKNSKNIVVDTPNLFEFTTFYKKKEVTIQLEFPKHQNEKAAEDFINRLKEMYLREIEIKIKKSRG